MTRPAPTVVMCRSGILSSARRNEFERDALPPKVGDAQRSESECACSHCAAQMMCLCKLFRVRHLLLTRMIPGDVDATPARQMIAGRTRDDSVSFFSFVRRCAESTATFHHYSVHMLAQVVRISPSSAGIAARPRTGPKTALRDCVIERSSGDGRSSSSSDGI